MAVVKPFRGVRYNPARFQEMSTLVSQPYDRIGDKLQQQYLSRNPNNIARVILGHLEDDCVPDQEDGPDRYTCAQVYYYDWLREGVFIREEQPVFYAYEQSFPVEDRYYVRLGLIAAMELAEYEEGIILPHERTHSGPKEDRLHLLSTLKVNTEQIFMLYPDGEDRINNLIRQAIAERPPDVDVRELFENDVRQRMWAISDPAISAAIQAEMAPKRNLIIADGHHRYETALNYRRQQRALHPGLPDETAFNYIGVTLISMDDPGLVVLPTHREIRNFSATTPAQVLDRAQAVFSVTPVDTLDACLAAVNAHPEGHAFGFYGGAESGFHVLTLKDDPIISDLIDGDHSHQWKSLAVTLLHQVLLERLAEVPAHGIEDKTMIRYHRDPVTPVENIDQGDGNFVFFVSATRMSQIKDVAGNGEKMPQKSTDFYPKLVSGLVLLPVGEKERLAGVTVDNQLAVPSLA